ncbi:glycosyltransferase family 9 protein [Colwellia piezophila]|uniref:glycosyltransferase family 9 protein n=1 Tax=Colwellia piezophila TaxID=211668 RepID=UPI00035C218C|nr:hypothetical protein [Colwellia piezophila]
MELNSVLFIPVSSSSGIGEYMRSLIIAKALISRWPSIKIHFILNEQVAYFNDCPFTVHGCKASPTKDLATVNAVMAELRPDLVVFDASGRASQFKQAKAVGAKVAFISQHNKKRSRGLKLNRLFNTDIHWVAQPDYCLKSLSYWQRAKLSFFKKTTPKNIGPVFELSRIDYQNQLLKKFSLVREQYFIFNAGSGGHILAGELAADVYYQTALEFYRQTNVKCVVIFGSNYPKKLPEDNHISCIKNIDNKDFISLIAAAQACVISAGDTLLQCIALHKPCVAAPVSPDQPARLLLCKNKQLVLAAAPSSESLLENAIRLIDQQGHDRLSLIDNMQRQASVNALKVIIEDIELLFTKNKKIVAQNSCTQGKIK